MRTAATTRAAGVLALLITLTVGGAACSPGSEQAGSTGTTSAPPTSPSPGTPPTTMSPSPADSAQVIEVEIKDGQVSPNPSRRVTVSKGQTVRIVLTSDQADELHLHGYEIEKPVAAGGSVTVEFVADQTGLFEVEVHELDRPLLFMLQVA